MRKEQLRQLISEGQLEEALKLMEPFLPNDVPNLRGRLSRLERQNNMGLINFSDYAIQQNQINSAALEFLKKLPDDIEIPGAPAPTPGSYGTGGTGDGGSPQTQTGDGDGNAPENSPAGAGGHSKFPFWFSLGAFAVLLGITLLVPGWWRENTLLARTLLALAAGGVAATLPGFLNFEVNNMLKAGGALAAFVLVFLVNPPKEEEPLTLTVFVVGKNGQSVQSLHQQGYILLDAEGERKRELIDDKGQAHFKNLRPGSEIRNVQVEFSEPYRPVRPDSVYRLDAKGQIYLAVALQNLGRIYGTVLSGDEALADVVVSVAGSDLSDTTDLTGSYSINIPETDQRADPEVKFYKQGYKLLTKSARPQTGQPLNVVMEKSKR